MSDSDPVRYVADAAWECIRIHGVPATPRNYEIWFAYCGAEKPQLNHRLDREIGAGEAITPGLLEQLYRTFFAAPVDVTVIRDGSDTLQQLAAEMADRVSADRGMVTTLGRALGSWSTSASSAGDTEALRQAAATLSSASAQAGERLRALEDLFTASVSQINDLKGKLAKAEHIATRDGLTGLANRRMFDAALQTAAAAANESTQALSLLLLDIDHFKAFNDTYGHTLGDNVLRLVARVLTEHTKGRDTAARYGGEEFAIILPGADLHGGIAVAEQVRQILERRPIVNRTSGQRLGIVTCSIGVAAYRSGEPLGELINRADKALYRAKREGRNTVRAETLQDSTLIRG